MPKIGSIYQKKQHQRIQILQLIAITDKKNEQYRKIKNKNKIQIKIKNTKSQTKIKYFNNNITPQ
jgi:hypothetical protein